jgi:hypothetical protein
MTNQIIVDVKIQTFIFFYNTHFAKYFNKILTSIFFFQIFWRLLPAQLMKVSIYFQNSKELSQKFFLSLFVCDFFIFSSFLNVTFFDDQLKVFFFYETNVFFAS